jgi:protease IV
MIKRKHLKVGFVVVTTFTVVAFWALSGMVYLEANSGKSNEATVAGCVDESIGVVKIYGWIHLTDNPSNYEISSGRIASEIDAQANNPDVKVILLDVYSPGGSTSGADDIVQVIKRADKPVIALVREQALSSAYLIVSAADTIYADRYAILGAMGVTGSFLSNAGKNEREGAEFVEISSGPHKDMKNPDRHTTAEERAMQQTIVNEHYGIYVQTVSEGRKISVDDVKELADGSIYSAEQAVELKLIDKVGNINTVYADLAEDGVELTGC